MPGPAIPRYRAAFAYAAGYTAVFLVVAVLRLSAEGPFPPPHLAALIPGLALVYGAGGVFALPLIWTLRRFRRSRKVPILLWWAAVPFSALGAVFGGLLGPPGILLLGGGADRGRSRRRLRRAGDLGARPAAPRIARRGGGAGEWTRTTDLLITNQLLCQLSYTGHRSAGGIPPADTARRVKSIPTAPSVGEMLAGQVAGGGFGYQDIVFDADSPVGREGFDGVPVDGGAFRFPAPSLE